MTTAPRAQEHAVTPDIVAAAAAFTAILAGAWHVGRLRPALRLERRRARAVIVRARRAHIDEPPRIGE